MSKSPKTSEKISQNNLVSKFREALDNMDKNLEEISAGGKKVFGYFCSYTPIEIIHAAGFLPIRIMGGTGRVEHADSLTPNFICPYIRQATERALKGQYDYLSGVIEGYTCDVVCGAVNVWEDNFKGELYHTIPLPYNDYPEDRVFFKAVINELIEKLGAIGGVVTEDSIAESLTLYAKIRKSILQLVDLRSEGKLPLSAADFLVVVQAGFVVPPEDFLKMVQELLDLIKDSDNVELSGIPVLISGSLIEEPKVLDLLEESGGVVIADDLCTGFRNFHPASGEGETPIDKVIDRYMNRFPCPSRSRTSVRIPRFLELVKKSGAKGVVFFFQKFCSPHLADHPPLVEALKEENIPQIVIEMEETGIMEGQMRTRLEGFFEMLGD